MEGHFASEIQFVFGRGVNCKECGCFVSVLQTDYFLSN